MTGLGSPCGACKFLRRKCVKGCVFAPYFCHEQGATHFAAIHKVFGASNVSKLLAHLPVTDRCEAAVTISYEAQARLQDPIYGCVSYIFALQQQVVNLQAQLISLKAQAAQSPVNVNVSTSTSYPQDVQGLLHLEESRIPPQFHHQNPTNNYTETMLNYNNIGFMDHNSMGGDYQIPVMPEENHSFSTGFVEDPSHSHSHSHSHLMASLDMQNNTRKWAFQDTDEEDLQSVAFSYLQRS
ncbi:LOB domain-containing protein 29-like [Telopea speciosissima]|uniref:LOB domain-containing protein 29-like n=1 Tax=Telopea speciosissima TaxID=54955 RepID=UPI001CC51B9D|nr:LOB domain-containing protein 29-like [Telopea speciosissima]